MKVNDPIRTSDPPRIKRWILTVYLVSGVFLAGALVYLGIEQARQLRITRAVSALRRAADSKAIAVLEREKPRLIDLFLIQEIQIAQEQARKQTVRILAGEGLRYSDPVPRATAESIQTMKREENAGRERLAELLAVTLQRDADDARIPDVFIASILDLLKDESMGVRDCLTEALIALGPRYSRLYITWLRKEKVNPVTAVAGGGLTKREKERLLAEENKSIRRAVARIVQNAGSPEAKRVLAAYPDLPAAGSP